MVVASQEPNSKVVDANQWWSGSGPISPVKLALLALSFVAVGVAIAFQASLVAVALCVTVLSVATVIATVKSPRTGFIIFCFGISIYYFGEEILQYRLGVSPVVLSLASRWQILFLVSIGVAGARRDRSVHFSWLDVAPMLFVCWCLLYMPTAPSIEAALYGFSSLTQFIFAYWAGRLAAREVRPALRFVVFVLAGIALFGIIQPLLLGPSFYITTVGQLPPTYLQDTGAGLPRASSIVGSPGYFGSLMMIGTALAVSLISIPQLRSDSVPSVLKTLYVLATGAILLGLAASFHRSSWAGATVACVVIVVLSLRWGRAAAIAALLLVPFISVAATMMQLGAAVDSVINLRDFSSASHIAQAQSYITLVLSHPWGLGLGAAGSSAVFLGQAAVGTEGGYSQIALQVGLLGLLLFVATSLTLVISLAIRAWRVGSSASASISVAAAGAMAGAMIFNLFLPFQIFNPALMILWAISGAAVTLTARSEATPLTRSTPLSTLIPTAR